MEEDDGEDEELQEEWKRMLPNFRTIRSLKRDESVILYLDYDKLFNAHLLRNDDDDEIGSTGMTCSCKGKCMKNCDCKSLGEACNENCGCDPRNVRTKCRNWRSRRRRDGWVTSNNKRTFITKDGDELTGRRAYRAYSKTSKFKKGKRKKRRRRGR